MRRWKRPCSLPPIPSLDELLTSWPKPKTTPCRFLQRPDPPASRRVCNLWKSPTPVIYSFEARRPDTSPKVTAILHFATRNPRMPVTVDIFETRRPDASPKVTTNLRFATRTLPIPVIVDIFETRSPDTSPKVTTVLRFATINTRLKKKNENKNTKKQKIHKLMSQPNGNTGNNSDICSSDYHKKTPNSETTESY